jgi:hypothetical protein
MWAEEGFVAPVGTDRLNIPKPLSKSEKRAAAGKKPKKPKTPRPLIPVLPEITTEVEKITKPTQRAAACVNMRLAGAKSFQFIADELGYANAQAAQDAYVSALAHMYPMSSWETMRQEAALRAEERLRRSLAMANADYFVDANDPKKLIPNADKIRWHEQSGKDLALHVMITGAKAPTRIEMSADTQELNSLLQELLVAQGAEPELEASVWDIDEVPSVEHEDIVDAEEVTDDDY